MSSKNRSVFDELMELRWNETCGVVRPSVGNGHFAVSHLAVSHLAVSHLAVSHFAVSHQPYP